MPCASEQRAFSVCSYQLLPNCTQKLGRRAGQRLLLGTLEPCHLVCCTHAFALAYSRVTSLNPQHPSTCAPGVGGCPPGVQPSHTSGDQPTAAPTVAAGGAVWRNMQRAVRGRHDTRGGDDGRHRKGEVTPQPCGSLAAPAELSAVTGSVLCFRQFQAANVNLLPPPGCVLCRAVQAMWARQHNKYVVGPAW